MSDDPVGEQLALFNAPIRLWRGGPHPRSLASAREDESEGGAFQYQASSDLFFGRTGIGPLRVAMDTAILIDYGKYGAGIWSDEEFDPSVPDEMYRQELISFAQLMHLWMIRDIRFHVFDRQLTDSKRAMSNEHALLRQRQVEQLGAALDCLGHGTDGWQPKDGETLPPPADLSDFPPGADRDLLAAAIDAGCHIFLTRDKALMKKAKRVARHWLALMSPTELLDALAEAGELGFTTAGAFLVPDLHKLVHVMGACDGDNGAPC